MRAFQGLSAGRWVAVAAALASSHACGSISFSLAPDFARPEPPLTAAEVTFAPLQGASLLFRSGTEWTLVDGTARTVRRMGTAPFDPLFAALSPDGLEVAHMGAVASGSVRRYGIFVARRDGQASTRVSTASSATDSPVTWSPDGVWLYFVDEIAGSITRVRRSGGAAEIVATHPTVSPLTCPMIRSGEAVSVSASGEVAFACEGTGIYVVGPQGTRLVFGRATYGGLLVGSPVWSADGTQIAFRVGRASIRITDAATGEERATIAAPETSVSGWGAAPSLCWLAAANSFVLAGVGYALEVVDAGGLTTAQVAPRSGSRLSCSG